jgi:hypothetical protein
VPGRFGIESYDVGVDKLSPVDKSYADKRGYPFMGRIEHVTFEFDGVGHKPTVREKLQEALRMD